MEVDPKGTAPDAIEAKEVSHCWARKILQAPEIHQELVRYDNICQPELLLLGSSQPNAVNRSACQECNICVQIIHRVCVAAKSLVAGNLSNSLLH